MEDIDYFFEPTETLVTSSLTDIDYTLYLCYICGAAVIWRNLHIKEQHWGRLVPIDKEGMLK